MLINPLSQQSKLAVRAQLGRRARPFLLALVGGWMVFALCIFVTAIPLPLMFGAFIAVMVGVLGLLLTVRCPRCRARLPQVGFAECWAPAHASKPSQCTICRLDLREPYTPPVRR